MNDLVQPLIIKSSTGSSEITTNSIRLTTGSAVWVAIPVELTNSVNLLSLEAGFLNNTGAQGLLSIYWNTNIIGTIDERLALPELRQYTFALPNVEKNTSHTLGFRLDPFSPMQSRVAITNVEFGYFGVKDSFSLSIVRTNLTGQPIFELKGKPGFIYRIETSTNLSDWNTVALLVNTNGTVRFLDPVLPHVGNKFFRSVAP